MAWIDEPDEDYDRSALITGDLYDSVTGMGAEPVCTGRRWDRANTENSRARELSDERT